MAKKSTRFPLYLPPLGQLQAENSDSVTKFRHCLGWEICNSFSPVLAEPDTLTAMSGSRHLTKLGGAATGLAAH